MDWTSCLFAGDRVTVWAALVFRTGVSVTHMLTLHSCKALVSSEVALQGRFRSVCVFGLEYGGDSQCQSTHINRMKGGRQERRA